MRALGLVLVGMKSVPGPRRVVVSFQFVGLVFLFLLGIDIMRSVWMLMRLILPCLVVGCRYRPNGSVLGTTTLDNNPDINLDLEPSDSDLAKNESSVCHRGTSKSLDA